MSSTQEGCSSFRRNGKKPAGTRRSWTHQEEAVLMASMKELCETGWKSDNAFKAGYQKKLEEKMKVHYPNTDLKGIPHINSKITTWKRNYSSLCSILSRSGVGFNSKGNFMIDCEDDTWEAISSVDANAKNMRYKTWPLYYDWQEIFGQDRATGETAEDMADAWNDMREEDNTEEDGSPADYDMSPNDIHDLEGASDSVSHARKAPVHASQNSTKKRKASDEVGALCAILADFGKKTDERLGQLADSIGYEAALGQAAEDAFEQLGKIEGLSLEQRFDVCEILSANVDKVKIFRGLPDSARPAYVDRLLRTNGK